MHVLTRFPGSIYRYRDVSEYLSAYFEFLKSENPALSLRQWSREMGFKNPDLLVGILKKKTTIKMSWVPFFMQGLHLDRSEQNYFKALVLYSNLQTDDAREVFSVLLSQYDSVDQKEVIRVKDPLLFSSWLDGAILEMGKLRDFKMTETEILNRLRTKVSKKLVSERIQRLTDEGLLEKKNVTITTHTDVPNVNIHKYYSEVSRLAKESSGLPLDEREFQCFAMAIRKQDLPQIKTLIREFRKRVEAIGGRSPADSVYQFNLQCFPLTDEQAEGILSESAQDSLSDPKRS